MLTTAVVRDGEGEDEWFCPSCNIAQPFTFAIIDGNYIHKTDFLSTQGHPRIFRWRYGACMLDPARPFSHTNNRRYDAIPYIPRLTKQPKNAVTPLYNDENLIKLTDTKHVVLCTRCSR
ncbi:hypothetical protein N7493_009799 [Penicillium malachiteum]|uniref:Uncharacterized protein n=1 Tax=Penicillium malachiteum TaxID=1324776 RepID=A0AAD6HEW5_9EURO|nr:hypothetical protein N7493_009799 [Penicillium malachiteum]